MGPESGADPGHNGVTFNSALGWSYVMNGGQYLITTVLTFVLAAILGPATFGLVAMAMVYLAFIQMLVRQGMIPALVQRRDLEERDLDSAFWMVLMSGAVLTVGSLLLSGWWANVNRTPELEPVINVLSVIIILQSLVVVPEALLSRQMNFRGLALRTNSSALVGGVVGLALALTGFGVWALVAQQIVKAVVDVVVLWGLSGWRPRFVFSWPAAKGLLGFSLSTTAAGFGDFLNTRADALLIGLFFGPTAVGLYRLAVRLVDIVVEVTVRSFHTVSLPELSRLQDDARGFSDRIVNMVNSTALIALPGLAILAGSSTTLMAVIGDEWAAAAAPLAVLCIAGAATALSMFAGPVALAVGRPYLLALVTWISAALSAASFVVAGIVLMDASVADQVLGIAVARVTLFSTSALALAGWVISRNSDTSLWSLVRAVIPATVVAGFAFFMTRMLSGVSMPGGDVVQLALVVIPTAILTVALIARVDPRVQRLLTGLIRRVRTG